VLSKVYAATYSACPQEWVWALQHLLSRHAHFDTQWHWDKPQCTIFETLKKLFISYPVLQNPDPTKHYILDTDASKYAIGATISQQFSDRCHPIAYYSKSLLLVEHNYDIYNWKLLTIIYAVKAFRYLLLEVQQKFLIQCNHENLKYFKSPQKISTCQAQWNKFLQDYNFELIHFPGKSNTITNLLSWRKDFEGGVNPNESITLLPEHLFTCKVYLEDNPEMCCKIIQEIYDTPVGGHPGISNTWTLINHRYKGPHLHQFVENYVKGYAKCQENKVITNIKCAPLYCFDTYMELGPFQYVSMDLITDLPPSSKYDSILTIMDQGCSKAAKLLPCNNTIDGICIA